MRTSRPPPSRREGQERSAFTAILERLLAATSGAIGAVLADEEGEAVDHAGELPAYDVKLAAAHWQIVLRKAQQTRGLGRFRSFVVQADRHGYVLQQLFGGYVLVMVCRPGLGAHVSTRALCQVEVELCQEAGFPDQGDLGRHWSRVGVLLDSGGTPRTIRRGADAPEELQVLKPPASLPDFARGYLIRTAGGARATLVRERDGRWYLSD